MSLDKKLKLTADENTLHFKAGDVIAGPLAFIYLAGKALATLSRAGAQFLLWTCGRVVEAVSPNFHKKSLNIIEGTHDKLLQSIKKRIDNPNVAFALSIPLVAANIGLPVAAISAMALYPLGLASWSFVYKSGSYAKLVKFALPVTYMMWGKAEGSRGHSVVHPVFQKTGQQLKRLDTYCEDKAPVWKRTKDLLKKAPLSEVEKTILEPMPKAIRKLPKMERAGVLAHHFAEAVAEFCGIKEIDKTYTEVALIPIECLLGTEDSKICHVSLPEKGFDLSQFGVAVAVNNNYDRKVFTSHGSKGSVLDGERKVFKANITKTPRIAI